MKYQTAPRLAACSKRAVFAGSGGAFFRVASVLPIENDSASNKLNLTFGSRLERYSDGSRSICILSPAPAEI